MPAHRHDHVHAHAPAAAPGIAMRAPTLSLLRMSALARLVGAVAVSGVLWACVALVLGSGQ